MFASTRTAMSLLSLSPVMSLLAATTLAASLVAGPPRISVREVKDATPGSAVLMVQASHHDQTESVNVVGRAEGLRNGKRVTMPLRLVQGAKGQFTVARQWETGAPWLLVLTAEEGPGGVHAVAEALVKIDAAGKVQSIEYPAPGWESTTNTPRRTSPKQIDALVTAMAGKP